MSEVNFVDTTLRDGHSCLWAKEMRIGMMLDIAETMDRAGFQAIELISNTNPKNSGHRGLNAAQRRHQHPQQ